MAVSPCSRDSLILWCSLLSWWKALTASDRWQYLKDWDNTLQEGVYALNQHSVYGTVSPTARIHRSRNQKVDMRVVPLTIIARNLLAKVLFPTPTILGNAGLCSKGTDASIGRHKDEFFELEVNTATQPLWAPCTSDSTGKKKQLQYLLELLILITKRKLGCYCTTVSKSISGMLRDPLGHPVI